MNHPFGQLVVVMQDPLSLLTARQVHGCVDRMRIIPFALLFNLLLSGCAEEADQDLRRKQSELEKITRLAEVGDPLAQNKLGLSYYRGENIPQDFNKALEWYRKAAAQEFADAQYNLGVMYDAGHGVPEDKAVAAKWYAKAAEQGNPSAQYNLGVMYKDGRGAEKNLIEAYAWYNLAFGDKDAQSERDGLGLKDGEISEARVLSSKIYKMIVAQRGN